MNPYAYACMQVYCNVEGVAWLDSSRLVLTSDRSKNTQVRDEAESHLGPRGPSRAFKGPLINLKTTQLQGACHASEPQCATQPFARWGQL